MIKSSKEYKISGKDLSVSLLDTGDIKRISSLNTQINLYDGNRLDGSVTNIYLRVKENGKYFFTPLLGIKSKTKEFGVDSNRALYKGVFKNISYQVQLTITGNTIFFVVDLKESHHEAELFFVNDIGIADYGAILSSKAYVSQYIDHQIYKDDHGYTLLYRQNQGETKYVQVGSLNETKAFATEGLDFYGKSYKETGIIASLEKEFLASYNNQYEFSLAALQSKIIKLNGQPNRTIFYSHYFKEESRDFPLKITYEDQLGEVKTRKVPQLKKVQILKVRAATLKKIKELYPERRHLEKNKQILSFFTSNSSHVVLKEKELLSRRQHGNIIISTSNTFVPDDIMTSTNFIYGVFNSHIAIGNTNFNKLMDSVPNYLNVFKSPGQRIYFKEKNQLVLLGLPSLYEMGTNYSKWIYILKDDLITITSYTHTDSPVVTLLFNSLKKHDILVTNEVTLGDPSNLNFNEDNHEIMIKAFNNGITSEVYPDLAYKIVADSKFSLSNSDYLYRKNNEYCSDNLILMHFDQKTNLKIDICGSTTGKFSDIPSANFLEVKNHYYNYMRNLVSFFKLTHNKKQKMLDRLNDISLWFTHNMMIHYKSPHGLEQYSGAAWGARDICQGPFEFMLATSNFSETRKIIIEVFKHQFLKTANFPQWFMFDKYSKIQADEAHGDVIIWPLLMLAKYLNATSDLSILDDLVPLTDENHELKEERAVSEHVNMILDYLVQSAVGSTSLPKYGGGDWDDTLQPANRELTVFMISGWTVLLLIDALEKLKKVLPEKHYLSEKISTRLELIKKDYRKHVIVDGIPAGFVILKDGKSEYLLHPKDQKTGLKYRLLPLTRGMIAEFYSKEEVQRYHKIIDTYLKHPDGVRLMDNTVTYNGGKNTYFMRAETAANFGREIGLCYVHAHIRYLEAMAKIGSSENAFKGLFLVNPIMLTETLKNAGIRQSNMYFTSSDAFFTDRYLAKSEFYKIKEGSVTVNGGWRLYSSGPGIYMANLIANILGIRIENENLVVDPVLPSSLNGLQFDFSYLGKKITINYHKGPRKMLIDGNLYFATDFKNKYRKPGYIINKSDAKSLKVIDVWF